MRRWILMAGLILAPHLAVAADAPPAVDVSAARAKIAAAAANSRANANSAAEKAIVEADLAFAADCAKRGSAAAFGDRMHPDSKMFPPRAPIVVGPEATRALFKDDKAQWEWAPVQAVANGDLGVTWGIALITDKDDKGNAVAFTTRYTTVWRRDASGAWKIWIDVGTPGPLP
jgi:ketosteroid isomerase-like protein